MNSNTINNRKTKNKVLSIALMAILAISVSMAFASTASAQIGVTQPETTHGFISVAPTLIGAGQTLTCNLWVVPEPTLPNDVPGFYGFKGVTVTFVKPDGTKDTFMPTDGTGAYSAGATQAGGWIYFYYVPSMAGNWSVSFTMPAQNITDLVYYPDYGNVTQYTACGSNTFDFTVQSGIVLAGLLNGYPWAQLPNANVYWSYPINDNNREWSAISGDWTGVANTMATVNSPTQLRWQPYGSGPSTPHIVWDNQLKEGGIIGGQYGSLSYVGGIVNSGPITVPVIEGMVYANLPNTTPLTGFSTTQSGGVVGQFECISLTTGQVMYVANGTISYGIDLPGNTYQQASAAANAEGAPVTLASSSGSLELPYLWGTATVTGATIQGGNQSGVASSTIYWNYYDPLTGVLDRTLTNCGSARLISGTVLAFGAQSLVVGSDTSLDGYLYAWNLTRVVNNVWNTGIVWQEPLPTPLAGGVQTSPGLANTYRSPAIFAVSKDDSVMVVFNYEQYWAYSTKTGASLWNLTLNYQTNTNEEIPLANVDDFLVWNPTANDFNCYSIMTGALLWTTPSVASSVWATTWTVYYTESNDLSNMYIAYPDGIVRAYSLTDGTILWASTPILTTEDTENALPFATAGMVYVGGQIYVWGGYSLFYEIDPVPRFAETIDINATNGDTIWTLNGGVWPTSAANGYVVGWNDYNGMLYGLGKGTTATSVTAQQQVGGSVLIQGSVLDASAACSTAAVKAKFPYGVPAISDDNMSVWMDYLYMQNATLLNAQPDCTGVPVTLTAVSSTGTEINLGTATSNTLGNYGLQWTPTTPGLYTIYATFAGSNSYYQSSASTYATVASTTTATATPTAATPTPAPTATSTTASNVNTNTLAMYLAIGVIIIVIAIAIVGILLLRKKP